MRYVDKHFWVWRIFISLVVVDLFVCKNDAPNFVYPIFRIDLLKPEAKKICGISLTTPWIKLTLGFRA